MKNIINKILIKYIYNKVELVIWDLDETLFFSNKCRKFSRFVFFLLFIRNEIKNISEFVGLVDIFKEKEKKSRWFEIVSEKLGYSHHKTMKMAEKILHKHEFIDSNYNLVLYFSKSKKKHIILTNSSSGSTKKVLIKLGFTSFEDFLEIIGIDNTLSPKPSTKVLEKILDKYAVQPNRTLVIGDSIRSDINPAKKLGIKTILVRNSLRNISFFSVGSINQLLEYIDE